MPMIHLQPRAVATEGVTRRKRRPVGKFLNPGSGYNPNGYTRHTGDGPGSTASQQRAGEYLSKKGRGIRPSQKHQAIGAVGVVAGTAVAYHGYKVWKHHQQAKQFHAMRLQLGAL